MRPRRQRFSISTNVLTRFSLLDALGIIAGSGFRGVEILVDRPHLYPHEFDTAALGRAIMKMRKHGLMTANLNVNTAAGYFPGPPAPDNCEPSLINPQRDLREWRVDYTIKALNLARDFRARNISIASGKLAHGQSFEEGMALFKQSLEPILKAADELDINVGVEYEVEHLIDNCDKLVRLIEEVNHARLGANFDIGHAAVNGEDISVCIRRLRNHIFHVHLDDIRGQKHEHLAPGFGDIDFHKALDVFDEIDYGGFFTWELYSYRETPREVLYITRAFINEALDI